MKKVLFVLAIIAVFGFANSTVDAKVVTLNDVNITLVADIDNSNVDVPEGEEAAKEVAKTSETEEKAKSEVKTEDSAAKKECSSTCSGK